MSSTPLSVSLIIVSTSLSSIPDLPLDNTSRSVYALLYDHYPEFQIKSRHVVPDNIDEIQMLTKQLIKDQVDVIVLSGGTGLSQTDVTFDAIRPIITKHLDGLSQLIYSEGIKQTKLAVCARISAGTATGPVSKDSKGNYSWNTACILSLPGSTKATILGLELAIPLLPHILNVASGQSVPHGHKNYTIASPFPMTPTQKAIDRVIEYVKPITNRNSEVEKVSCRLAKRVIASDIFALEDVPNYDTSLVDGYALNFSLNNFDEQHQPITIAGSYSAGQISAAQDDSGMDYELRKAPLAYKVATGSPIPSGTVTIVMVENVHVTSEGKLQILKITDSNNTNIRKRASDMVKGDLLLTASHQISSSGGEIGSLIAAGYSSIKVYPKPIIGVFSTGCELVDGSESQLQLGQVRDANRPALFTAIQHFAPPCDIIDYGIIKDDRQSVESTIQKALEACDLVISSGGVSMGDKDFVKDTLLNLTKLKIRFGRVCMKPGKPTIFAEYNHENKFMFGLPGNPVSALVTFHLFVLVAIKKLAGFSDEEAAPKFVSAIAHNEFRLDHVRDEFQRCFAEIDNSTGQLCVKSLKGHQLSSRISSFVDCNALVFLPKGKAPNETIQPGQVVKILQI